MDNFKKTNKLIINLKSYSLHILKWYIAYFFLIKSINVVNIKMQPIKMKQLTELKSPHKYKRAQQHFQLKIYKVYLTIDFIHFSNILLLLNNKPQGLFLSVKLKQELVE